MDTIPKIILQNPYRILGVYANSAKRDVVANKGKATAFLKVNRPVEFPLDLKGILPPINRTLELMNDAEAHLAIAKEQIKYAQFWFIKITPIDDIAFNHLLSGNVEGAKEMWSKQESVSSLQNKVICYLIEDNPRDAVLAAERLYEKFGDTYINKVDANCTLQMSGTDLLHQFLDSLGKEIGYSKLIGLVGDEEAKNYIKNKTIGPLISRISSEVERAKRVDHKDPMARIKAAWELATRTEDDLKQLRNILPWTDSQYQMIADKLGLEILQCSIDYYNNSNEDDAAYKSMEWQRYAQSIVVGTLAKQRCEENVKILQKIIDELPPKEVMAEYRAIKAELSKFVRLPDKISYAVTLLNNTKPHLQNIKNKLGATNNYYLKLSTQIVSNALHNVIEEVNAAQKPLAGLSELLSGMNPYLRNSLLSDSSLDIDQIRNKVKATLREAWKTTMIMDGFDMDPDFKTRYNQNRNTLKSICNQMGIPTYGTGSSIVSSGTTSRTHAPSGNGGGSGCVLTLLAFMGMAATCIYCFVSII